ncbi:hypothetical protein ASF70_02835 [Rhizobium sp. Leaf321]|uniref:alpha/beta fold hydrolase n=1 Tax=Rhizobium sp. Leaf321 TaxID=1736335 RepID=UPI0007145FFB|nr:alpha/beta hydrolase [Rhizobium sp. Leaf321]KQQ74851.1 hypothetical protein ASF70_02835 [Rhizobium sp. Leaf321]
MSDTREFDVPVALRIHRGFVEVGGRLIHYMRQGRGPALVLLHAAPCSARVMEPLQAKWSQHFTTFAFDLPGFGISDMVDAAPLETADLADAIAGAVQALGLKKITLYGRHTGAGVAVELARRHPALCNFVLTDGFPVFSTPYTPERLAEYLTEIKPQWDGGHLTWTWFRYREQHMFWPWDKSSLAHRADSDLPDLDFLYRGTTELLAAADTYADVYASAFRHPGLAMIDDVKVPVVYGNRPGDSQFKTVSAYPDHVRVQVFSRDHEEAAAAELEILLQNVNDGAVPVHDDRIDGQKRSVRSYLDLELGPVYIRGEGLDDVRPPILFLPDLPGGVDLHVDELKMLAQHGPVLGFDPWGNGNSIAADGEELSIGLWARQAVEILRKVGYRQVRIYASGTSAAVAAECARLAPDLIDRIIFRSPPAIEADSRFVETYAPDIAPEWSGGNFLKLWHHLRDQELWWPWNQRTVAHARRTEPRIAPAFLNRRAITLLRQPLTYRVIWQTVLAYPLTDALKTHAVPGAIVTHEQDLFAFAADAAGRLRGDRSPVALLDNGKPDFPSDLFS